jgi:DUF4097 and DUF4098 domain-containing protein YvlB
LGAAGKRSGILVAGIMLVAVGVILLIAPRSVGLAAWLGRLWPLFLVLAGLFRVAGFAIERRPRSPLGGALLVAVGIVLLVAKTDSEPNLLAIYGKYWIVVLGIYSLAELLRFYSHRQGDGAQPRLFSIPKLLTILFIGGTGILSGRAADTSRALFSSVRIPASLASLTDSGAPHTYTFEDPPRVIETGGAATATISNSRGDINIVGGARSLRIVLIKILTALGETEARNVADQIKLSVERIPGGIRINTNRDQVGGDFKTNMRIELPPGLAIAVANNGGTVSLSRADGPLSINATRGAVSVAQVAGNVDVLLDGSSGLDASQVGGNLSVQGARDAKIASIGGGLDLKASNGSVDLSDVRGPVRLDAPSCKIKAANLVENSVINSGDSTIDVVKASSLAIDGPGSRIRAQQVNGDLQISSSGGSVQLMAIQGAVTLSASHSSVAIDGLKGEARVRAAYAPVAVRNLRGSAFLETSYGRLLISPGDEVAEIRANNNHGDIKIDLPRSAGFQLSAAVAKGYIRCPNVFGSPNLVAGGASLAFGNSGPVIVLTTVDGDIVLEQVGSHR